MVHAMVVIMLIIVQKSGGINVMKYWKIVPPNQPSHISWSLTCRDHHRYRWYVIVFFRRFKPSIVESTALCRRPPLVFVGFRCGAEYKDNIVAVDICNLMRHVVWFQMRSLTRVRVRLLEVLPVVLCCSKSCHCCRRLHFPVSRPHQIRILASNSFVIVR